MGGWYRQALIDQQRYQPSGSHRNVDNIMYYLLIFLVFCVVLLYVVMFWVPCCDVRYDFRIITMFGTSLSPVVCRRTHVLFTLFVFVCVYWCPTHIVLCLCVVFLHFVYHMLPVSLDCHFFITPSVFSNVYLPSLFAISSSSSITYHVPPQQHWWFPTRPVLCPLDAI